jgi:hypothetical protein
MESTISYIFAVSSKYPIPSIRIQISNFKTKKLNTFNSIL